LSLNEARQSSAESRRESERTSYLERLFDAVPNSQIMATISPQTSSVVYGVFSELLLVSAHK